MQGTNIAQQLRNSLKSILRIKSKLSTKIALLKSFKENLKVRLNAEQKKILLTKAVLGDQILSKENTDCSSTLVHSSDSAFKRYSLTDSYTHLGQLKQLKLIMLTICRQYDYRTQLNSKQYELQQLFRQVRVPCVGSCLQEGHKQSFQNSKLSKINTQLSKLLAEFANICQFVKLQYQNIQDHMKLLRVKYILQKERRREKKAKRLKQQKGKEKSQNNYYLPNDENKNQYLVNL